MESARTRTVRKRMEASRVQILDHARNLITQGGVAALTARSLAQAASVSLSTLYSLVGKREEILSALFTQTQDRVRERMQARGEASGLAHVELLANEVAALFGEDEGYYKASQLAMEQLDEVAAPVDAVVDAYRWGDAMIVDGIRECAQQGLFRGRVPLSMVEDFAIQGYRSAYRRWGVGQLSIDQVRVITLAQSYIVLMADATEAFQAVLDARMDALASEPGFDRALLDIAR